MARKHKLAISFDGGQWGGTGPLDTGPGAGLTRLPLNSGSSSGGLIASPDGDSLGGLEIAYVGFDYPMLAYGNDMSQQYQSIAWKGFVSVINQTDTANLYSADFIEATGAGPFLRTTIPQAKGATGGYTHTPTTFTYAAGGFGTDSRFVGSACAVAGGFTLTITSHNDTVLTGTWNTEPDADTYAWVLNNTNSFNLQVLDTATPTAITPVSDPIFKSTMATSDIWEFQVDTGASPKKVRILSTSIAGGFVTFGGSEDASGWIAHASLTDIVSIDGLGGTLNGKSPTSGVTWRFDWLDVYDNSIATTTEIDLSGLSAWAVTARYAVSDAAVGDYTQTGNAAACGAQLWPAIDDGVDVAADLATDSGTRTGASITTLEDTAKSWITDEWVGRTVTSSGKTMVITSNSATILTGVGWNPSGAPTGSTTYTIAPDDYISEAVAGITECRFGFAPADVGVQTNATVEGVGIEAIAPRTGLTVTDPSTDFAAVIKYSGNTDYLNWYKDTFSASSGASYFAPTAGAPALEATAWTKTVFDAAEIGVQGKAGEATKVWGLIAHICGENLVKQADATACPAATRRIFIC